MSEPALCVCVCPEYRVDPKIVPSTHMSYQTRGGHFHLLRDETRPFSAADGKMRCLMSGRPLHYHFVYQTARAARIKESELLSR